MNPIISQAAQGGLHKTTQTKQQKAKTLNRVNGAVLNHYIKHWKFSLCDKKSAITFYVQVQNIMSLDKINPQLSKKMTLGSVIQSGFAQAAFFHSFSQ